MKHNEELVFIIIFLLPFGANAYVDPGAGVLFWQGLIVAFGAVIIFLRRPLSWLRKIIESFNKNERP